MIKYIIYCIEYFSQYSSALPNIFKLLTNQSSLHIFPHPTFSASSNRISSHPSDPADHSVRSIPKSSSRVDDPPAIILITPAHCNSDRFRREHIGAASPIVYARLRARARITCNSEVIIRPRNRRSAGPAASIYFARRRKLYDPRGRCEAAAPIATFRRRGAR